MFITVTPAYGADYKSQKQVREAWKAGKDFIIQDFMSPDCGRYINNQDAPKGSTVNVRYDRARKVLPIKVK